MMHLVICNLTPFFKISLTTFASILLVSKKSYLAIYGHVVMQTSHAIATALNVVQTSHSHGDLMLITKASEFKQVIFTSLYLLINSYIIK